MFWECFSRKGLLAESVASVTSHKPCQRQRKGVRSSGWRCGCSRYDFTSGVWRDDPGCLCVFSWHCELQKGPVLGPDQAVLRRLTLGGRTVPTPFFAAQRVTARDRVTPRDRGFRPCHRTTLCSLTAKWFGELRMGPTLRDTLDTGLCCSSQGRGHRTIIWKLHQCRGHVYYTNLQSTAPYGETVLTPGSYLQSLQWFPFIIRHITLMGKGWVSNAFDGWTNVFPDAWWAPQGPMHIFSDVVISLGISALLLQLHIWGSSWRCSEAPASFCSAKPCQTSRCHARGHQRLTREDWGISSISNVLQRLTRAPHGPWARRCRPSHRWVLLLLSSGSYTGASPPLGFLHHLLHPLRLIMDYWEFPGLVMLQLTI